MNTRQEQEEAQGSC